MSDPQKQMVTPDTPPDTSYERISKELLNDTSQLQKAFEKAADEATSGIPPLPSIPSDPDTDAGHNPTIGSDTGTYTPILHRVPDHPDLRQTTATNDSDPETTSGQSTSASVGNLPDDPVSSWFFTLMCMNIPIIGWIYLIWLAFNKKVTRRRNFARAYLFYKLIFLGIAVLLVGILVWIGLDLLDQLLAYMEML